MRFILTIIFLFTAQPSLAACRLHKVWHYPWPQHCGYTRFVPVALAPPIQPNDDRSWTIEITKMPAFMEDTARQEGINKLKEKLK